MHPRTFSLGFDARDRSELEAARRAAAHFHTVHTDMMAPAADFEQALEAIPSIFDEPFARQRRVVQLSDRASLPAAR